MSDAPLLSDVDLVHRIIEVGEVRLHAVDAGEGPLVVLLHGFPEFWYSWRHQIPVLVRAGYRVVAPDMRGYNLSDKPEGVAAYDIEPLVADIAGLLDALSTPRATVVGHDWGAAVAWGFAMRHADRLERLAILNGPHPMAMLRALRTARQLRKSWYIGFFQLPGVPERALRRNDFAAVRRVFERQPVTPDAFSSADIDHYIRALSQPGALTAALNYYRALRRLRPGRVRDLMKPVDRPVRVIWGERDVALGVETASPGTAWAPHLDLVRIPDGSHWIQIDAPRQVNEALLSFLGEPAPRP